MKEDNFNLLTGYIRYKSLNLTVRFIFRFIYHEYSDKKKTQINLQIFIKVIKKSFSHLKMTFFFNLKSISLNLKQRHKERR